MVYYVPTSVGARQTGREIPEIQWDWYRYDPMKTLKHRIHEIRFIHFIPIFKPIFYTYSNL